MTLPPRHVGIFGNRDKDEVRALLPSLLRWIHSKGRRATVERGLARGVRGAGPGAPLSTLVTRVDVVLVLGGDGAMLHAARAASRTGVPIFGINLGGLGFLTDTNEESLYPVLMRLFRGEFQVERRIMVEAVVRSARNARAWTAVGLNDAVIHARDRSRVVAIDIRIGRTPIGTLVADGLIVATPTGSTAYSLSAGGPIIHPRLGALLIAPICPHTLTMRPLVVPDSSRIEMILKTDDSEVYLTLDGQVGHPLRPLDRVRVRRGRHPVLMVRRQDRHPYFEVLRHKLHWGER